MTTQITWDFSSEIKDTTLAICKGRMSILVRLFVHHPLLKFQSRLRFQRPFKRLDILNIFTWCPGAESNHRHEDFQSTALPTELPGQMRDLQREGRVLNPRVLHASSNLKGCALSGPRSGFGFRFERRVLTPRGDPKQLVNRWLEVAPV